MELALEVALERARRGAMAEHSVVVGADLQMAKEVLHEPARDLVLGLVLDLVLGLVLDLVLGLVLDLVQGLVLAPGWPVA